MENNKELKCKLEEMAASMGYEVHKKFKKEIDPIYKVFTLIIIFGFLTVTTIMGTYLAISLNNNTNNINNVPQKIIYVNGIIEKPVIIKERKKTCSILDKKKGFEYIKTIKRKNRIYEYYRSKNKKVWEFYTVAYEKGDYNGCKFQRK